MKKTIVFILGLLLVACAPGTPAECPACPACPAHTPYPTYTPYPTHTPAAMEPAAPEPMPTLPSTIPQVEIAEMTHKRDSIGNLIIMGLVKNAGGESLYYVQISCVGRAADGSLVDLQSTFTEPSDLAPGGEGTFTCYLEETTPISEYECKVLIE